MRMRRKAWTEPLLAECPYLIDTPRTHRGHWREFFADGGAPTELEIGCGKGVSTVRQAHENPAVNLIAIDEVRHVLAVTIKNATAEYRGAPIDNLLLSAVDAMFISDSFAPEDEIRRIYINFPNPWDKKAYHEKRRLTHPRQLMQYRGFLKAPGEIFLKTDSDVLFEATRAYMPLCGFQIDRVIDDLHASGYAPNYISEHEALYAARGIPIRFLTAHMIDLPADFPAGLDERLLKSERGVSTRCWDLNKE